jgi:hypothetical protein
MPYLKDSDKDIIYENGGMKLEAHYTQMKPEEFAGALNYLNFRLIKRWINDNGKKYWIFALFTGTLVCCVLEVYRRLIGPYEDEAIKKNGDVIL